MQLAPLSLDMYVERAFLNKYHKQMRTDDTFTLTLARFEFSLWRLSSFSLALPFLWRTEHAFLSSRISGMLCQAANELLRELHIKTILPARA